MEASKLTISRDHLRFQPMGRNKKADLRRKNIITLIRNTPTGTPITLAQFQEACAYKSTAAVYGLLKTMLDRGTIVRSQEGLNRFSYVVAADAVSKPAKDPTPRPETPLPMQKTLGDYARDFAWEKNSDSLREFVQYMDGIELDLRRMIGGGGY